MLNSEAHIATDRASRYLAQLCQHAGQMGEPFRHRPRAHDGGEGPPAVDRTSWSDTRGRIEFKWGICTVEATESALTLRAEAADKDGLRRIEDGIAKRLETIGRRDELTVTWQRAEPGYPAASASVRPAWTARPRRPILVIGLVGAGVVIVAVHVGLFGRAAASSPWTTWGANVIVALVAVKLGVVVTHVLLARRAARRLKQRIAPARS